MTSRGSPPESLLEELSLAGSEFDALGEAEDKTRDVFRLKRSHLPIPLESILEESHYQSRLITFDPDRFPKDAELLASVKEHGVLEPVYLERLSNRLGEPANYRPIAGHRRVAAARSAGHTHIDAIVANNEDDIQAFALAENLGHRQLTAYEKALSLMALKASHPRKSLRDLARRSSLPFGTVSSLISAYEKSTPVLRRRFAEGMAPRAVQELQPVFEGIPEAKQKELSAILGEASQPQACSFRQMVERGVDPIAAARTAVGFSGTGQEPATGGDGGTDTPTTGRISSIGITKRVERARKKENPRRIPDPEDKEGLTALATRTGIAKNVARRLAREARSMEADYTTLTIACAHAAACGDAASSLEIAARAAKNRSLVSVVRRHLDILERVKSLIGDEKDREVALFVRTIFFGA